MITRPFLTLLLGAFLVPVSMESAQANPFSAQSHSPNSFLEQRNDLALSSAAFVVANPRTGEVLSERNANRVMPIASITKLMTALVVLDANQRLSEMLTVTMADVDRLKGTGSRLAVGSRLSRADMLHIALMSSENRAASALARNYPGGQRAFIEAMNAKARMLGMWSTQFSDSTGLTPATSPAPMISPSWWRRHPPIRSFASTPPPRSAWCATASVSCTTSTPTGWCAKGAGPSPSPRPATSARRVAAW
ncbi:peptidase S11 [Aeromonas hydrophila]|nr:peptidase S11 [Aeromonas hydrophila]